MAVITNFVTSATPNTATSMLATGNLYNVVVIQNQHASADVVVNIGATAVSTGTIAGGIVRGGQSVSFPVAGNSVSVASGTASITLSYFEDPN